jgi:predicted ATPase
LKSRRQQLHARIARAIETEFPKIARKEPNVLAHHFGQAGLVDKAITYHEQAGRRALAGSALAEALTQFSSALEQLAMLPRSEERLNRELSIHLAMGSALDRRYRRDQRQGDCRSDQTRFDRGHT